MKRQISPTHRLADVERRTVDAITMCPREAMLSPYSLILSK